MKVQSTKDDHKEFLKDVSDDGLREVAELYGISEDKIPLGATRKQLVDLILAANRVDLAVAKTVRTTTGKDLKCDPGHMVIRVTPKSSGGEWGKKAAEQFFFAINGEGCVGRRGVEVVISDKYRSCWENATKIEYDDNPDPGVGGAQQRAAKREVQAEDVNVLYWNRDLEAEAALERAIVEGSKKYQEERAMRSQVGSLQRMLGAR
jgi:hypothetical protein